MAAATTRAPAVPPRARRAAVRRCAPPGRALAGAAAVAAATAVAARHQGEEGEDFERDYVRLRVGEEGN